MLRRRLFVYGTLQPQADTPMARWLAGRTVESVAATVPGRLYAIPDPRGWYPAGVAAADAAIAGALLTLDLAANDLARLDRYEGRDYRRTMVRARAGGALVAAQAWRWDRQLPARARPVPSGDFRRWLDLTGHRAFR